MKKGWIRLLEASGVALALSAAVVGLAGFGWGHMACHGQKFVKHIVDAHVEEAEDKLQATADQRAKVSAMEDRLIADFKAMRQAHRTSLAQVADQFGQEQLDPTVMDQAFAAQKQSMEQLHQDVRQTVLELHDLLTPTQRQQLASMVKEHLQESGCPE